VGCDLDREADERPEEVYDEEGDGFGTQRCTQSSCVEGRLEHPVTSFGL
jgi:hypothetical protein